MLKKTTYYAEQLPRRLDYRFDEKYSISYLKNQKRSFNELATIATSIGLPTTVKAIKKERKNMSIVMLSNSIVKAIYGDILPSITGVTSSIKNQQAENKRIEKKEIEETGENIMNINFDDTSNDNDEMMDASLDDGNLRLINHAQVHPFQQLTLPPQINSHVNIDNDRIKMTPIQSYNILTKRHPNRQFYLPSNFNQFDDSLYRYSINEVDNAFLSQRQSTPPRRTNRFSINDDDDDVDDDSNDSMVFQRRSINNSFNSSNDSNDSFYSTLSSLPGTPVYDDGDDN